jgi:hypothetical protein
MSVAPRKSRGSSLAGKAHIDELLDEALNETFPASDSVAISIETAPRPSKLEWRREKEDSSW